MHSEQDPVAVPGFTALPLSARSATNRSAAQRPPPPSPPRHGGGGSANTAGEGERSALRRLHPEPGRSPRRRAEPSLVGRGWGGRGEPCFTRGQAGTTPRPNGPLGGAGYGRDGAGRPGLYPAGSRCCIGAAAARSRRERRGGGKRSGGLCYCSAPAEPRGVVERRSSLPVACPARPAPWARG